MKQRKLFTALIVTASAIAGGSLAYASNNPADLGASW
ncbi:MAG: MICOS complex subunit MIC60 [Limnobacter sp.]|nr:MULTISPECIES: MICOS complex subunit MIC60 [unclassified Limnobacter]